MCVGFPLLTNCRLQSNCGGRIVITSSCAGQIGLFGYTAYSSSKFALRGFAESLVMEAAPSNIFVTLAYPPNTQTPGFDKENEAKPALTRQMEDEAGLYVRERGELRLASEHQT